jgi:hypothetical protein
MAGHMDEVVDLIAQASRGAELHGFLLSAALLPEPMVPMLKMYINTYRPEGQGVTLYDMQRRVSGTTNAVLFNVLCIPVPNLAAVSLVLNGRVILAQHFIDSLHRGLYSYPAREQLPPGQVLLEHDDGKDS